MTYVIRHMAYEQIGDEKQFWKFKNEVSLGGNCEENFSLGGRGRRGITIIISTFSPPPGVDKFRFPTFALC